MAPEGLLLLGKGCQACWCSNKEQQCCMFNVGAQVILKKDDFFYIYIFHLILSNVVDKWGIFS